MDEEDANFSDDQQFDSSEEAELDDSSSDQNTNPHSNDVRSPRGQREANLYSPDLYGELEVLKHIKWDAYCHCSKKRQGRELFCSCGEEDQFFEWVWDHESKSNSCELLCDQREVRFHSGFSTGTAVVKSNMAMLDRQYFWEIKMISPVYGTDMMVGIGTDRVDPDSALLSFKSFLGLDSESWGLSCYGNLQHDKHISSHKWARFGQGSIIGFHLDTWLGHLHLYKNRIHLGVIFRKLRGKKLYAMAASTAARTGMRLIRSASYPSNLVYLCCNVLRKYVPERYDLLKVLNFPPGLREFLRNNLAWLISLDINEPIASSAATTVSTNKIPRKHGVQREEGDDTCTSRKKARRDNAPSSLATDICEEEESDSE